MFEVRDAVKKKKKKEEKESNVKDNWNEFIEYLYIVSARRLLLAAKCVRACEC